MESTGEPQVLTVKNSVEGRATRSGPRKGARKRESVVKVTHPSAAPEGPDRQGLGGWVKLPAGTLRPTDRLKMDK